MYRSIGRRIVLVGIDRLYFSMLYTALLIEQGWPHYLHGSAAERLVEVIVPIGGSRGSEERGICI